VNFGPDGKQQQLYGYAIAAKRYALFTRTLDGGIHVEKASAHGLGFLYAPISGYDKAADAPVWVVEAWNWILRKALDLPAIEPSWFGLPAMMRLAITTPEVLRALQARQKFSPYRDKVKPFNFVLSPILDKLTGGYPVGADTDRFTLIAPFTSNPLRWHQITWVNIHDGKQYRLAEPGRRLPYEIEPSTFGEVVSRYRWHAEAKSLGPDEKPCGSRTVGLLRRTPVIAAIPFASIGKETDRRWEREEDISLIESFRVEYRPNETERLVADVTLQHKARQTSIRSLAKASAVSEKTVKSFRKGRRIRKSTALKIARALKLMPRRAM
jgi:hypothetical protein